jgi:hypothetical protein
LLNEKFMNLSILRLCLALPLVVACNGSRPNSEASPDGGGVAECDAYVVAYDRCLTSLGPADVAHGRAEQTRATIAAQLVSASTSARAEMQTNCARNLARLKATCQ